MGSLGVRLAKNQQELNEFTRFLLKDIQALDRMLAENWFETKNMMIGAEQEICLIDTHGKPAPTNLKILEELKHDSFTTELARFNIEANLKPVYFTKDCFQKVEAELRELLGKLKQVSNAMGISPILTGILPTIRKFDLGKDNLTPLERYYALIGAISKLRGGIHHLKIEGLDELNIKLNSALIEACNTSFQVHLQVSPEDFVRKYNIAQAIAAPVLAVSSNSPMLFGKRLWHETRIALFQQSVDTRVTGEHLRYTSPRVTFGDAWVKNSILDLYKEDIVRFKVLIVTDVEEDVFECLDKGITPKLRALNIHNSTVYRWNRPCYGISASGKPHLRIENRILPSGPTVIDELANAAFWLGLMNGMEDVYGDITKQMDFDDAKGNFMKAARVGLGAKYVWCKDKIIDDTELIQKELLPIAKQGLEKAKVNQEDISKYLDIIEERTKSAKTGARWIINSYARLKREVTREEATTALVASLLEHQSTSKPVHEWDLATVGQIKDWRPSSLLVEEFMTTDIFTVSSEDILDFALDVMDWKKINYLPIESENGELIGLLTLRHIARYFADLQRNNHKNQKLVKDLMIQQPITIQPEESIIKAIEIMTENSIGCLPVVNNQKLVGIITEANFIGITTSLLKRVANKPA